MHLTLHLTGRCNLRCRYCYDAPHTGGDMTWETARAAIELACARRGEEPSHVSLNFFGGEPLLRRALILDIMRECHQRTAHGGPAFQVKMTTNGMLLDEAFLSDPDMRDIFIALSLDGIPAVQDTHRVTPDGHGTFAHLSPTIDLLLQYKPYAPVMAVVTPETVMHYADSVAYLFERGFHFLIFTLNYAGAWTDRALRELERQYRVLARWYLDSTAREEKFYFSPFDAKIASHILPGSCRAERCELGYRQISVAPDGRLYPCVQFVGDEAYVIGHVATGIDEAARTGLRARQAQEQEECLRCAIRERCNHFCGCLNKQTTGRVETVSPVLCAHERIVLPIADRIAATLFKQRNPLFLHKQYNELYPLLSLVEDRSQR